MKKKIILTVFVGFCLLMLPLIAGAEPVHSGSLGSLSWTIDKEGLMTISGEGEMTSLDVYIQPYEWLEYKSEIKSINILEGVTSISDNAFYNCFNLNSISIPDSTTTISYGAFYGCSSLSTIVIPDSMEYIGESVFYGCSSLNSITIPNGITTIGISTFKNCSSLTHISFPNSLTKIRNNAFEGCSNLTSIVLPDSVKRIEQSAFFGCSRLSSFISYGILYIGDCAFDSCSSLSSITIPEGVKYINRGVFGGCSSLANINIPESITSIRGHAFYGCTSLSNITIPESVTSIGEYAFYGCTSLSNITIPESVTSIGGYAFGCTSLSSITIPDSITSIGDYVFADCHSLTNINIPKSVTSIGKSSFSGCSSLTSISIPDNITEIDDYAFICCSNLTCISIPEGVTSIGNGAFEGCYNLKSITLPASVVHIGDTAFDSTKSVMVLGFDTVIGKDAFPLKTTLYCYSSSDAYEWGIDHERDIFLLDGKELDSLFSISAPEAMRISVLEKLGIPLSIFPRLSDQIIVWESSNEQIVKVDQSGVLTPISPGTAIISLTVNDKHTSTLVTVSPALEYMSIDYNELYTVSSGASSIIITTDPASAICRFKATISDSSLVYTAFQEADGFYVLFLYGRGNVGQTTLTITETLSGKSVTLPIRVARSVKNVTIKQTEIFVPQGCSQQLDIDVELSNGIHTNQSVGIDYNINSNTIASIAFGWIIGLTQGETTLRIDYHGTAGYSSIFIPKVVQ